MGNGNKVQVVGFGGPIWFMGWLFTVGFANLTFFKGFVAIVLWPYFLGLALR